MTGSSGGAVHGWQALRQEYKWQQELKQRSFCQKFEQIWGPELCTYNKNSFGHFTWSGQDKLCS